MPVLALLTSSSGATLLRRIVAANSLDLMPVSLLVQ